MWWVMRIICLLTCCLAACTDEVPVEMPDQSPAPPDMAAEPSPPADLAPAGPESITFFAFGDPQYGGGPYDKNSFNVLALNQAPALVWPKGEGFFREGQPVGAPRGVIIAGDLTQNGQSGRDRSLFGEWYVADRYAFDVNKEYGVTVPNNDVRAELGLFLRDYGLRGNDGLSPIRLAWRVFEGYGNHEFDVLQKNAPPYGSDAPARDIVSLRNQVRASWPEMRRFAAGNAGHYSWDWAEVHFVQLNLVGADTPPPAGGDANAKYRDPKQALAFLRDDLAAVSAQRRLVLVMHYGFDDFGREARWWTDAQRQELLDVLAPRQVLGILHGHTHETRRYTVTDPKSGKSHDVISLGSPYYKGQSTNAGRGHFAIFHIEGDHLDAADVAWEPQNPDPDEGDNNLAPFDSDGWGGWKWIK